MATFTLVIVSSVVPAPARLGSRSASGSSAPLAIIVPAPSGFGLMIVVLVPTWFRRARPSPWRRHVVADVNSTSPMGPGVSGWTAAARWRGTRVPVRWRLGGIDLRLLTASELFYLAIELFRVHRGGIIGSWAQVAQNRFFTRGVAFSDSLLLIRSAVVLRYLNLHGTSSDFLRGGSYGMGYEVYEPVLRRPLYHGFGRIRDFKKELEDVEKADGESSPPKQVFATLAGLDEDDEDDSEKTPPQAAIPEDISAEALMDIADEDGENVKHKEILTNPITPKEVADPEALEARRKGLLAESQHLVKLNASILKDKVATTKELNDHWPIYHKFHARLCYIYKKLKISGTNGMITVSRDFKKAQDCEEGEAAFAESVISGEEMQGYRAAVDPAEMHTTKEQISDQKTTFKAAIHTNKVDLKKGATYQCTMQQCLKDQIDRNMHAYVDDIAVMTRKGSDLISNLHETFDNLRGYKMMLNPLKYVFGVPAGKLLGFIVSHRGIEVNPEKMKDILNIKRPSLLVVVL
ncbi:hypothetical protein QYE76_007465 [Lolium multiflorum]|uniref:Reverse transcriptase domain-containing protein n=1 Tax=Lolium multiflorum TaxID=4521 RepID=A0AAD8W2S7_LOLMU|nr:hypothetical protein QYE76_007465 [Lolium multiflorum]